MQHFRTWSTEASPMQGIADWISRWQDKGTGVEWPFVLETMDNPGWLLRLARSGEGALGSFGTILRREKSPFNWIGGEFDPTFISVMGGGTNLQEILSIGQLHAAYGSVMPHSQLEVALVGTEVLEGILGAEKWFRHDVEWLTRRLEGWYISQCNGDREHTYGLTLRGSPRRGWELSVELSETPWADVKLADSILGDPAVFALFGSGVTASIVDSVFVATASVDSLASVIASFFTCVTDSEPSDWSRLM